MKSSSIPRALCFAALFGLLISLLRASGPGAESPALRIDAMERTSSGWVATVTGVVRLPYAYATKPGEDVWVTCDAEKARISVPTGNQLYSVKNPEAYAARLRSLVGQTIGVQMWGPRVTFDGLRIVEIIAGDVSFLRPLPGEAAFDMGRLMEIIAR